jgi:hypothetical protein
MEETKERWDEMRKEGQIEFLQRLKAEESVKEYLKNQAPQGLEYVPINYYAKFLKDQLNQACE